MKCTWESGLSKEFARLASDRSKGDTPGTNTIEYIHPNQLPSDKTPTYVKLCANYRPQKADPYRVWCTLGGNLIQYLGPKSTAIASLPVIKILINSVLSTPNAKFCSVDIKDFHLNTDLPNPEYISVPFNIIPPDIVTD